MCAWDQKALGYKIYWKMDYIRHLQLKSSDWLPRVQSDLDALCHWLDNHGPSTKPPNLPSQLTNQHHQQA